MRKSKVYTYTLFSADVIKEAAEVYFDVVAKVKKSQKKNASYTLEISFDDEMWTLDSVDELFAEYRKNPHRAHYHLEINNTLFCVRTSGIHTYIDIEGNSRPNIQTVFETFEKYVDVSKFPERRETEKSDRRVTKKKVEKPTIFIGHGQSNQWKYLKDHLHEKHDYDVEAYETGARAGQTIKDILENMISSSSIAFLVMTADDTMPDGTSRARQNVIHEIGLFQGRLGFSRAIVLLEKGTAEFSNIFGIQQIRFSKDNILETFGEVLATLKREFPLDQREKLEIST